MKNKSLLICCVLLIMALTVYAGKNDKENKKRGANRTTVADLAEEDYDIKYLRFNLNVSDTSVYVSGNVVTTAQVTVTSMSSYVFELDTVMIIDSAQINGVTLPVTHGSLVQAVNLPTALTAGAFFTAQI